MRLWRKLSGGRRDGLGLRRQHSAGPYGLDFYCPQLRLSVELDASQHGAGRRQLRDERRSAWLCGRGATELRFWNNDITQNLMRVLELIEATAEELRASGATSTQRWRADLALAGEG